MNVNKIVFDARNQSSWYINTVYVYLSQGLYHFLTSMDIDRS